MFRALTLLDLVGKTIAEVRGTREKRTQKVFPEYLLFDDEKTILHFEESANESVSLRDHSKPMMINVYESADVYKRLKNDLKQYPVATEGRFIYDKLSCGLRAGPVIF